MDLIGNVLLRVWCDFYLTVALHSIDERFISHNLCLSIEEGLETILGLLKLLLGDLWKQRDQKIYF